MKILQVTDTIDVNSGGTARACINLQSELSRNKINNKTIVFDSFFKIINLFILFKIKPRAILCHCVWSPYCFLLLIIARIYGLRVGIFAHGMINDLALLDGNYFKIIIKKIILHIYNRIGVNFIFSSVSEQGNAPSFLKKISIIENIVNWDLEGIEINGENYQNKNIFYFSRFTPRKGLHHLLEAFTRAAPINTEIVVIGLPDNQAYEAELKNKYSGRAGIKFVDGVRGGEAFRHLSGLSFNALLSEYEGLPMSLLESLSVGIPVIISPNVNLIIPGKQFPGFIVEEIDDCVRVIHEVDRMSISDYKLLSSQSKDYFQKYYSTKVILDKILVFADG